MAPFLAPDSLCCPRSLVLAQCIHVALHASFSPGSVRVLLPPPLGSQRQFASLAGQEGAGFLEKDRGLQELAWGAGDFNKEHAICHATGFGDNRSGNIVTDVGGE